VGGAPDANDEILSALADILRTGRTLKCLEAQRILLRRIALGGDVIPSRIPPPKNITEVGGYINLPCTSINRSCDLRCWPAFGCGG
jgi:hypothetical protein